jgi:hypothetical protein
MASNVIIDYHLIYLGSKEKPQQEPVVSQKTQTNKSKSRAKTVKPLPESESSENESDDNPLPSASLGYEENSPSPGHISPPIPDSPSSEEEPKPVKAPRSKLPRLSSVVEEQGSSYPDLLEHETFEGNLQVKARKRRVQKTKALVEQVAPVKVNLSQKRSRRSVSPVSRSPTPKKSKYSSNLPKESVDASDLFDEAL